MAKSVSIEEESGIFTRNPRRHNGYYAGDFSRQQPADPWRTLHLPTQGHQGLAR